MGPALLPLSDDGVVRSTRDHHTSRARIIGEFRDGERVAGKPEPFGPNWIVAENQPCQVYLPFPDGGETITWSGSCVDGKASGMGRAVKGEAVYGEAVYEGEFRAGMAHDEDGIYTVGGYRHEGAWREGMPHGYGILVDPDGDRHEGEWRNGCFEQDGTQFWFGSKEHCGW